MLNGTYKGTEMIYAYLRVSTDTQDTENQRTGVEAKARALGLTIDKYIVDDGISGTKEPEKRALGGDVKAFEMIMKFIGEMSTELQQMATDDELSAFTWGKIGES